MNRMRALSGIAVLLFAVGCTSNPPSPPAPSVGPGGETPSATFVVRESELLKLSAGASGKGTVIYNGWEYRFKLENMTLSSVGEGQVELEGTFFNLNDVNDAQGTFKPMRAEMDESGELRGLWMQNEKGVIAFVQTAGQSVAINLGTSGSRLTLQ